jgi:predicted permease
VAIVASLAVASTLTLLVFGVINAMLGGTLPGITERERLVRLRVERAVSHEVGRWQVGDFRLFPAGIPGIAGVAAEIAAKPLQVSAGSRGGSADGAFVSGSYFTVLGTRPVLGRLLQPSDDQPGAAPVAVIGHHFWQQRFDGSQTAIGSTMLVATVTFEIVGVAPPGFTGLAPGEVSDTTTARGDIWMPMVHATLVGDALVGHADNVLEAVARLDTQASGADVERSLQALVPRFNTARAQSARERNSGRHPVAAVRLKPFHLLFANENQPLINALVVAAIASVPLLILGIACANVAGIQLARATGRTHELAVRVSLGAARGRVVRLLALETGLLALIAGATGWIAGTEMLRLSAGMLPIAPQADGRLFLLALMLPVFVAFIAGVLPAWRATGFDVVSGLRLGSRVGRTASPRTRRIVVIVQMSLSVALLIAAGTLIRGLAGLPGAIAPAFNDVLVAELQLWGLGWNEERERQTRQDIVERVRALPGVQSIGVSPRSVFNAASRGGDGLCRAGNVDGLMRLASPEFFDILRLPVVRGRALRADDDESSVVINETFASRLETPDAAIGTPIRMSGGRAGTVVGVVRDSYERFPAGRPRALCYPAWAASSDAPILGSGAGFLTLFVRTDRVAEMAPLIRKLLRDVDPRLGPSEIGTMPELMRGHYRVLYGVAAWLSVASAVALAMAAMGLFGIIAYGAALRTREFGVRLALGAQPAALGWSLVRESSVVVIMGAMAGIGLAAPVTWLLSQGLASTRLADPVVGLLSLALLVLVTLMATMRPIARVCRLDPASVLRAE